VKHCTFITLGVKDHAKARKFYRALYGSLDLKKLQPR